MAKQLVLILGGARSGKSRYAQDLAPKLGSRVAYLATAEARDDEMQSRIANHRAERPADWQTLEAAQNVGASLARVQADVVILDCLTLLVTNVMLAAGESDQQSRVNDEVVKLIAAYRAGNFSLVIVSNEVGLGIVPENPLARAYRDLLGAANQQIARVADSVLWMVAGLPMRVK
ncbi:MAG: bifunctional adenosylcobinamide kinase/adenosylcobinamide-phosphate guanylyltransferase [Chloroflexi bacterium]|nr:bifunctional adenosylcobinamide kinase/adenosylcobinamide-phosphate guanylyltransferase [Chloroflexota bacterium]